MLTAVQAPLPWLKIASFWCFLKFSFRGDLGSVHITVSMAEIYIRGHPPRVSTEWSLPCIKWLVLINKCRLQNIHISQNTEKVITCKESTNFRYSQIQSSDSAWWYCQNIPLHAWILTWTRDSLRHYSNRPIRSQRFAPLKIPYRLIKYFITTFVRMRKKEFRSCAIITTIILLL